jgi:hypothetical protein
MTAAGNVSPVDGHDRPRACFQAWPDRRSVRVQAALDHNQVVISNRYSRLLRNETGCGVAHGLIQAAGASDPMRLLLLRRSQAGCVAGEGNMRSYVAAAGIGQPWL